MVIFLCVVLLFVFFLNSKVNIEFAFSFLNKEHSILKYDYDYSISIIYFKKLKTYRRKDVKEFLKKRRNNNSGRMKTTQKYFNFFKNYLKFLYFENVVTKINVGLISTIPTIYIVPIISTILSFLYSKCLLKNSNNCTFVVEPIFGSFELLVHVHGILSIKIANIIYILFMIWVERRKKDGRTSDRRSFKYSYE